jgi:hypothetical protein
MKITMKADDHRNLSEQTARAERKQEFKPALELWSKAMYLSIRPENKKWVESRN